MKHPIVYIYKRTSDHGQELKYSMRSLDNVKNWSGEVFVAGDREGWMSDKVQTIDGFTRSAVKHIDHRARVMAAINDKRVADTFILFHDDFYITEPTEIKYHYSGYLEPAATRNEWQNAKANALTYLQDKGIDKPKNYDIHVPMIFEKGKLKSVLEDLHDTGKYIAYRSVYGNLYNVGGSQYKDRKTTTRHLLKGNLLSTRLFTKELQAFFPDKSEFEL